MKPRMHASGICDCCDNPDEEDDPSCEQAACSPESEAWILGSPAPDSNTRSSPNPTHIDGTCCEHGGPECRCTTTYETWAENKAGELFNTGEVVNAVRAGRASRQTTQLIFSAVAFLAKTSASPDNAADSPETDPDCSSSSPESSTLFDPDGYSSRTYPGSSPRTAVGTSESSLERWPTSGTAWDGGFSTHVSSECRSAGGECSSSEPSLTEILEPPQTVPVRYSLSGRAARGILRRAEKRGRILPGHLAVALEAVAGHRTPSA